MSKDLSRRKFLKYMGATAVSMGSLTFTEGR